jgi:hypothetical protein
MPCLVTDVPVGHEHSLPGGQSGLFRSLFFMSFSSTLHGLPGLHFGFLSPRLSFLANLSECHPHGSQLFLTCSWLAEELPGKDLSLTLLPCSVRAWLPVCRVEEV